MFAMRYSTAKELIRRISETYIIPEIIIELFLKREKLYLFIMGFCFIILNT
jgi:hypothetical protein